MNARNEVGLSIATCADDEDSVLLEAVAPTDTLLCPLASGRYNPAPANEEYVLARVADRQRRRRYVFKPTKRYNLAVPNLLITDLRS